MNIRHLIIMAIFLAITISLSGCTKETSISAQQISHSCMDKDFGCLKRVIVEGNNKIYNEGGYIECYRYGIGSGSEVSIACTALLNLSPAEEQKFRYQGQSIFDFAVVSPRSKATYYCCNENSCTKVGSGNLNKMGYYLGKSSC